MNPVSRSARFAALLTFLALISAGLFSRRLHGSVSGLMAGAPSAQLKQSASQRGLFTAAGGAADKLGATVVDATGSGAIYSTAFAGGSIGAISLAAGPTWHLVKVVLYGGAHAGSYYIQPTGTWKAHFAVSDGGYAAYDVDWIVRGNNIVSGVQGTAGTAPASVTLTFAGQSWGGPNISQFCAIAFTSVQAGANARGSPLALAAQNFDVQPAHPTGYILLFSAGTYAEILPQATGGFQQIVEGQLETVTQLNLPVEPAMLYADQASITVSIQNQAAATLYILVFYTPSNAALLSV